MKKVFIIVISLFLALTIQSQQNISVTSISVTGNKNLQLAIDGKGYSLTNSIVTGNRTILSITLLFY